MSALRDLEAALDALSAIDVSAMPAHEAAEFAHGLKLLSDRVEALRLAALSVVDASGLWGLDGSKSMKAWIVRHEGVAGGAAGADLRTARALRSDLPLTAAALAAGEVSLDHAKALARYALSSPKCRETLADPERGERLLLAHAGSMDADRFGVLVRTWAARADPEAADDRYRAQAGDFELAISDTAGGTHINGFVDLETGQLVRTALDAAMGPRPKGDTRTPAQRRAGALADVCRLVLDQGLVTPNATVRPHLMVGVDLERLVGSDDPLLAPGAWLNTGEPLPSALLGKLACDAEVTRVVFGPGGVVLDVGRSQRTVPEQLRKAVILRDGTCRYPGCYAPPRICECHHCIPWEEGGVTSMDNSVLLCGYHHGYLHRNNQTITWAEDVGAWEIKDDTGTTIGLRPSGTAEQSALPAA